MTRVILGIDPGVQGGFAILDAETGKLVDAQPFPLTDSFYRGKSAKRLDGYKLATLLDHHMALADGEMQAVVEAVSSRPRQAGQFQFGINTGIIHGILYAHGIPFTLVAPATWKSFFGIKREEGETKQDKKSEARQLAAKLYPEHADKFRRIKDDGVAEAVLIALSRVGQ